MPLPDCNEEINVSMRLYTRTNPNNGDVITKTTVPSSFRAGKRVHFVVHGWLGGRNANYLHAMKDAGLDDDDVNMIIVGWEGGSRQLWYPKSASETRVVGTEIALVAQNLVDYYGTSWSECVCAGHSLGGHVCGHAGKRTRGGDWGRITGMDPAGPWFEGKDHPDIGLDPSDATLVDVMHTNGEAGIILNLGTMKPLGHMDFYPNGGGTQPGCIFDPWTKPEDIDPMIDLTPACSHMRVLDLYIESMKGRFTNCKFISKSKCTDPYNIPGSCTTGSTARGAMGFFANTYEEHGIFYLTTSRNDPYCSE
jgi:pancreatic triacylglycerol lipase